MVIEPWMAKVALPSNDPGAIDKPASLRFLSSGTLDTEIPGKYLMPVAEAIDLVVSIFRLGALPDTLEWDLV